MLSYTFAIGSGYVVPSGATNTKLIEVTENRKDAFNRVIKIQNLPPGGYQVQVRRINCSNPEIDEEYRDYFKGIFFSLTGITNKDIINLPKVNGVDCKIARSAYKFESTSKTNGQIEGISGIVQTIARIWDGTSWNTLAPTNNPASLFLYVLTHPANAYRIEESEVSARVDLYILRKWYEYCENPQGIVPASSVTADQKFQYNNVMDGTRSVLDVLRDICAAGRASPAIMDGRWTVIVDKPRNSITQHFTPHNSWGFESTKALPKLPHAFRVVFRDEANGYQEDEQIVYNNGYTINTAEIFEELSLPGVTNRAQVINHARWHLAQSKLRPERYTLNTDFEYLVCNRGDLVKVMHDVPMWGLSSGRIKQQVDSDTLLLDEPVNLVANTSYTIRIRTETGSSITRTVAPVLTTGTYNSINTTTSLNATEGKAGNLFILGTLNQESHDLIVLNIEPLDNKNARLTLVDYAGGTAGTPGGIYTLNLNTEYPIPAFNPSITRPPNSNIIPITTFPEIVKDPVTNTPLIRSDIGVMDLSAGILNISIPVVYNLIREFSNTINRVELSYSNSSSPNKEVLYKKIDIVEGASNILIPGVVKGDVYTIKLRYIDSMDRIGPWSPEVTHTVVGKTQLFDTITAMTVTRIHKNLVITPVIVNRSTDFSNYEFRIVQGNLITDFWDTATNYVKVTSVDSATVDLMQFPSPRLSVAGVTYSIACRAMDYLGNYSTTSYLQQIILKPLVVT